MRIAQITAEIPLHRCVWYQTTGGILKTPHKRYFGRIRKAITNDTEISIEYHNPRLRESYHADVFGEPNTGTTGWVQSTRSRCEVPQDANQGEEP